MLAIWEVTEHMTMLMSASAVNTILPREHAIRGHDLVLQKGAADNSI